MSGGKAGGHRPPFLDFSPAPPPPSPSLKRPPKIRQAPTSANRNTLNNDCSPATVRGQPVARRRAPPSLCSRAGNPVPHVQLPPAQMKGRQQAEVKGQAHQPPAAQDDLPEPGCILRQGRKGLRGLREKRPSATSRQFEHGQEFIIWPPKDIEPLYTGSQK